MASTHSQVHLFFKCHNLVDADTFSKSDPYVVVKDVLTGRELGRTEVVMNNLNPEFKTSVAVDFFFELKQVLRFDVWDKDRNSSDFLGTVDATLGAIMSAKNSCLTLNLSTKGTISVTGMPVGTDRGTIRMRLIGRGFRSGKCSYVISRRLPNGQKQPLHESKLSAKGCNPQWESAPALDLLHLCGGDTVSRCIAIDCYSKGLCSNTLTGTVLVSVEQLLEATGGIKEFPLSSASGGNTGAVIQVTEMEHIKAYDFTDFLKGGMEVNIAFSIDFTSSNGDPRNSNSLHFYSPTVPNAYIRSMLAVSDVVQEYDSDRQFPAYGFGAVAPFTQGTSHFFPLNGNPANAYLNGMQAVVDTYAALLPQLRLSGPTNFAPTISTVAQGARQARGVYTILLILTDGAITDMQNTIDAIVACDDAPVSIVIIGVGNADFSSMERLDGDEAALVDRRGKVCRRDLVQFVPFNQFQGKEPARLAAAVLEEIPRQVEVWGRLAGVRPGAL